MMRASAVARAVTSYVTDIEGNMEYYRRFADFSAIVKRDPATERLDFRRPESNDSFVYGGDMCDKGTGDIRLPRLLTDFKRRHPDRVHLVLGNRDLNKLRLTSFLDPASLATPPSKPFFLTDAMYHPLEKFVEEWIEKRRLPADRRDALMCDRAMRLRWVLRATMGAQGAFELRREELAALSYAGGRPTDADVVESYLDELAPGGAWAEYLDLGRLAVRVDNALFAHGSVDEASLGFVPHYDAHGEHTVVERPVPQTYTPGDAASEEHYRAAVASVPGRNVMVDDGASVDEWLEQLEAFKQRGLRDWRETPGFRPDGTRGGAGLLAYAHLTAMGPRTVAVTNFLCNNTPAYRHMSLRAVAQLNMHGIDRVVVGHKPSGDTPGIIRQPGMLVAVADNSYCGGKRGGPTGRGRAVTEIILNSETGAVHVRGRRATGQGFDFNAEEEPLVGLEVGPGKWTRAVRRVGEKKPGPADAPEQPMVDIMSYSALSSGASAVPDAKAEEGEEKKEGEEEEEEVDTRPKEILVHTTTDSFFTCTDEWVPEEEVQQAIAAATARPSWGTGDGLFAEEEFRVEPGCGSFGPASPTGAPLKHRVVRDE